MSMTRGKKNTTIHDVIARLCYCHRPELSMQMHGRIGWQKADGASICKRWSVNLSWCIHQDLDVLHQEVKMDLQEAIFDNKAIGEELRTQKLKVDKMKEQNIEIPEI